MHINRLAVSIPAIICWRLHKDLCLYAELAVDDFVLGSVFNFDHSISSSSVSEFGQVLWCFYIVGYPVVFSLVLFIFLLIYVNLCLSHLIPIDLWNTLCRFNTFMLPLYSRLTLWHPADYIYFLFWSIVRWDLDALTDWTVLCIAACT